MVLKFEPPTDLVNAYLQRPSPGQEASQSINEALKTYVSGKQASHKAKIESLGTLLKAGESVDLTDPAVTKAFAPLFKEAGVDPSVFNQPPTPSSGTVSGQTAGTTPENSVSPIVQASLDAGHPDHSGVMANVGDPNKLLKTGFGRKKLVAAEAAQKLSDSQQKTADAESEKQIPFEDVGTTFQAANEKTIGDKLIEDAKASGLGYVPRSKLDLALKGLGVKNAGMRGGALDSMAATREQALRQSLNKDARDTLNPMFQKGEGRNQMMILNRIGRAEPLIEQMMSQKGGGDKRQMREFASSLDRIIRGGGQSAQSQIDDLMPDTARGKFAHWQEWFTNEPTGTEQKAFISRYADTLGREKKAVQGQVKSMAEGSASTLRVLKQHYPEDYQAQLDSVLKNSQLVGDDLGGEKKSFIKPGEEAEYEAYKKEMAGNH